MPSPPRRRGEDARPSGASALRPGHGDVGVDLVVAPGRPVLQPEPVRLRRQHQPVLRRHLQAAGPQHIAPEIRREQRIADIGDLVPDRRAVEPHVRQQGMRAFPEQGRRVQAARSQRRDTPEVRMRDRPIEILLPERRVRQAGEHELDGVRPRLERMLLDPDMGVAGGVRLEGAEVVLDPREAPLTDQRLVVAGCAMLRWIASLRSATEAPAAGGRLMRSRAFPSISA